MNKYLINELMPNPGLVMSVDAYILTAMENGYTRKQAIGSLGGSKRWETVEIVNKMIYRIA